ncbi:MAG: hypothetical protein IJH63_07920 [Methanobrevibacter sp.]|nr:hypothetical protein [Methanobrevibacter sp.]
MGLAIQNFFYKLIHIYFSIKSNSSSGNVTVNVKSIPADSIAIFYLNNNIL